MKTLSPSLFLLALLWFVIPASALAVDDLDSRYVTLEPVVVNMESSERARYLQAKIQLEAGQMEDAREIRGHIPAVRDRLIRILGGRAPDSLRGSAAREELRQEALEELNDLLEELTGAPRIEALYFSDFIRQ